MSEENKADMPLLDAFMKAGKISVFESGLDRPDHLQDRPFFKLLPKGQTSFVNMSETSDKLYVKTAKEQAEEPAFDTEAHKFFEEMEKRFRTVMPGVTLFIIDPDAVQGRYLMDRNPDRSLEKSLYMHVESKLHKAAADKGKTFLTQEEILESVKESGITDRNPFSLRAPVSATAENLGGLGNVALVVGDNPDAMTANVLDDVYGAEERRLKEGISRNEFRRLVLYHELGHATDNTYCAVADTPEKVEETELDSVMNRHRTECIADAHAVLQLARDFGTTKCAELWSDCRMEYLRICVENRLEDTKYDNDFIAKLRAAEEKNRAQNPNDPEYENNFKQLMNDKSIAETIQELGTPLAYHTTDVIDATVKWTKKHLADGSLQKMTDLEVIKQAQIMSETYGLTRQQMAEMSIALAKGETHPKYEQMMERVQESRDHMPIDNKVLAEKYELQKETMAYSKTVQLYGNMGLPAPEPSPKLKAEMKKAQANAKRHQTLAGLQVAQYQSDLLDKMENVTSRKEMHEVLGQEKETLRTTGKKDKGKKDLYADYKLKLVDSFIEQAPQIEIFTAANKSVKQQLDNIKSSTEVSGDEAIIHFITNELEVMASLGSALNKAYNRNPCMSPEEQLKSLRSENKDVKKAMIAEKETQIAAFAIRSDKETWAKISSDPTLATLVDQKARQKPTEALTMYQINMSSMTPETLLTMFQEVSMIHNDLTQRFVENPGTSSALKAKNQALFDTMKLYAEKNKADKTNNPVTKAIISQKKQRG